MSPHVTVVLNEADYVIRLGFLVLATVLCTFVTNAVCGAGGGKLAEYVASRPWWRMSRTASSQWTRIILTRRYPAYSRCAASLSSASALILRLLDGTADEVRYCCEWSGRPGRAEAGRL